MFIELTNYETGQKELVNTRWIEEIRNNTDYSTVYFAFHVDSECTQDCLKVEEEYNDIKQLLGLGDKDAKIVKILENLNKNNFLIVENLISELKKIIENE